MLRFDIKEAKPLSTLFAKKNSLTKVLFLSWLTTIITFSFIFIAFSIYFKINDFRESTVGLNKAHIKSYERVLKANVKNTEKVIDLFLNKNNPNEIVDLKLNPVSPKDGYIYVLGPDKKIILSPNFPKTLGKTISFKNPDGVDFSNEIILLSKGKGKNFTHCRKGKDGRIHKFYCFMKVGQKDLIICSEIPMSMLDSAVRMNIARLKINMYLEMAFVGTIFLIIILLTISYIIRLSKSIKAELASIIDFLENNRDEKTLNAFSPEEFQYKEFAIIGASALEMVKKIKRLFDWLGRKALEAETANQEKINLLSGITDDFQTELNTINLTTKDLLKSDMPTSEKDKVNKILNSVSEISSMLKDIEASFMFDNAESEVKEEDINLKKLSLDILEIFQSKAKEKELDIELDSDDSIPEKAIGDPLKIRQLLIDMAQSVLSLSKKGTLKIRFELDKAKSEDKININFSVGNKDAKLSESDLTEIQSYPKAKPEFSVLSLKFAACKHLADRISGRFYIDSSEEKGLVYKLELPLG